MMLEARPIGIIHSSFSEQMGTPIQPVYANGAEGTVEVTRGRAGGHRRAGDEGDDEQRREVSGGSDRSVGFQDPSQGTRWSQP